MMKSGSDKSMIDRIMLRFRPIAPKPTGDGSSAGESAPKSNRSRILSGRAKRKYVRARGRKKESATTRRRVAPLRSPPTDSTEGEDLFSVGDRARNENQLVWLNFEKYGSGDVAAGGRVVVVESWVTVENVTDTCAEEGGAGGLGMMDLEGDTCPWFVSDGFNLVQWVNEAYKKMVAPEGCEVRVWLVTKEKLSEMQYPAFACRVRVEYTWQARKQSRTVPCDVWRIDGGGFAWRLDVKAALSLAI